MLPKGTPAVRPKKAARPRRLRQTLAFGAAAIAIVGLAITAKLAMPYAAGTSAADEAAEANRIGTIVIDTDGARCPKETFDNRTGKVAASAPGCQQSVTLDGRGIPIPMGTIHTLDGIRESFNK